MGGRQVQIGRPRCADEQFPIKRQGPVVFSQADTGIRVERPIFSVLRLELCKKSLSSSSRARRYLCRSSSTKA